MCWDFNLTQFISNPTRATSHCSNILDLCLSTDPNVMNNLALLPGLTYHLIAHPTFS